MLWFVKFIPLFVVLYPIRRAQWYQGGSTADYVLCRRKCFIFGCGSARCDRCYCADRTSWCSVDDSGLAKYEDVDFPKSVRPETTDLALAGPQTFRELFQAKGFSRFRHAPGDIFEYQPADEAHKVCAIVDEQPWA